MRRTRLRRLPRVGLPFRFTALAHNIVRLHRRMTKAETIVCKWRFTAMNTWDRDYIDLVEPGDIAFATRNMGEMAFGVVTATLDCAFDKTKCDVSFDFAGFDEGDEVAGHGWAEMTGSDTITGEIEFRNGDDTTFEACRW